MEFILFTEWCCKASPQLTHCWVRDPFVRGEERRGFAHIFTRYFILYNLCEFIVKPLTYSTVCAGDSSIMEMTDVKTQKTRIPCRWFSAFKHFKRIADLLLCPARRYPHAGGSACLDSTLCSLTAGPRQRTQGILFVTEIWKVGFIFTSSEGLAKKKMHISMSWPWNCHFTKEHKDWHSAIKTTTARKP